MATSVSLGELAVRFGCELRGNPDIRVDSVAPLANAHASAISFLASSRYRAQLPETRAAAVILEAAAAADCRAAALIAENPHALFARIASLLYPRPVAPAGVHPSAVVSEGARVDPTAHIGALAYIGPRAVIGARAFVGPHCIVEQDAVVAEDVQLVARVTLCHGVHVGARAILHPGVVIGADGFGFAAEDKRWLKVPQVGTVRLGADVEIGANTTIDRGAIEDTVLEEGVKLDNQIQIGHNVRIGAHTAMAACVGISGSVTIGKRCMFGGASGAAGQLSICDDVTVTGMTLVSHSITTPGVYSSGIPAEEARSWRRIVGRLKRIDSLAQRLSELERAARGRAAGRAPLQEQDEDDD